MNILFLTKALKKNAFAFFNIKCVLIISIFLATPFIIRIIEIVRIVRSRLSEQNIHYVI